MAAVALEDLPAGLQALKQVKALHRAGRTPARAVLQTHHGHRAVILLRQPGRHDPQDAGMPAFLGQDHHRPLAQLFPAHQGRGLPEHGLLQGLALPVQVVQIIGLEPGLGQVVAQQQLQGAAGLAHAAGGVEPRRQPEDHVPEGDGLALQPGHFLQGHQAGTAALFQNLEPLAHQDAVLPQDGAPRRRRCPGPPGPDKT